MSNELWCPLGDSVKNVSQEVIEFLKQHHYIDVIEKGKYLFTLKRIEKGEKQ